MSPCRKPKSSRNRQKGRLSRDISARSGSNLRAMYTDVVNEGVPDRFTDLLRRLDDKNK